MTEIAWTVELLARDPVAADRVLRAGCERLSASGATAAVSAVAGGLAEALRTQGHGRDAQELAAVSRATSSGVVVAQVTWRRVQARLHAIDGEVAEAERLLRDAIEMAARTDAFNTQAEVRLKLARVLCLDDRGHEAAGAAREALRLFTAKGNVVSARHAQALLDGWRRRPPSRTSYARGSEADPAHHQRERRDARTDLPGPGRGAAKRPSAARGGLSRVRYCGRLSRTYSA